MRWVNNATAISSFTNRDLPGLRWPEELLARQLADLEFDNGPHSLTRVVFRVRLLQLARSAQGETRRLAVETLRLAAEQGSLLALSREPGEPGWLARRAYQRLLHPAPKLL